MDNTDNIRTIVENAKRTADSLSDVVKSSEQALNVARGSLNQKDLGKFDEAMKQAELMKKNASEGKDFERIKNELVKKYGRSNNK